LSAAATATAAARRSRDSTENTPHNTTKYNTQIKKILISIIIK